MEMDAEEVTDKKVGKLLFIIFSQKQAVEYFTDFNAHSFIGECFKFVFIQRKPDLVSAPLALTALPPPPLLHLSIALCDLLG